MYGVTCVVIAPEAEIVNKLTTPENKEAVENYKLEASKSSEIEKNGNR